MPESVLRRGVSPPSPTTGSPGASFSFTPFFGLGIVSASTHAYTTSPLDGAIARPMRPLVTSGKPPPFTSFHVSPPSVDFHSAEPGPPLLRKYGPRTRSQLDAYSTLGSRGSITRSTKPALSLTNLTRRHDLPPSVVL